MHSAALLAVLAAALAQVAVAEIPPELKAIVEECQKENAISQEELMGLKTMTIPQSEEGKCFLDCVMMKKGVLVDGKFNKENAEALAKKKLEEKPEELDKHLQLIAKCSEEVTTEGKCETGAKLMQCMKTNAPEFDIILPGSA